MRAYYLTLWAVTIGDIQLLRQVSDEYKLSIHDMRLDGSLPMIPQEVEWGLNITPML